MTHARIDARANESLGRDEVRLYSRYRLCDRNIARAEKEEEEEIYRAGTYVFVRTFAARGKSRSVR